MHTIKYFLLPFSLVLALSAGAQTAAFPTQGKITYEKRTSLKAILTDVFDASPQMAAYREQLMDNFQKNYKPFQVLNFDLSFDKDKTYYAPGAESPETQTLPNWLQFPAVDNKVYTDFATAQSISLKDIIGTKYYITDSTRRIHWKITEETKDILGYPCRRANALIMDSVYIVAFYTSQIPVSGGPESISGLPGMILQLALPHEHSVWTATKVTTALPANSIALPPVGKYKQMTGKEFYSALETSMKSWGPTGKLLLRASLL